MNRRNYLPLRDDGPQTAEQTEETDTALWSQR